MVVCWTANQWVLDLIARPPELLQTYIGQLFNPVEFTSYAVSKVYSLYLFSGKICCWLDLYFFAFGCMVKVPKEALRRGE